MYNSRDIEELLEGKSGETKEEIHEKISVIYARVSSDKQRSDLERQINDLRKIYPNHEVIQDISSGLNFNRKGLQTILDKSYDGLISEIVVSNKDRLARFGVELIEYIFNKNNVKLVVHNKIDSKKNPEIELSEDIISIITVFSARYHGSRSAKNRRDRKRVDDNYSREDSGSEGDKDEEDTCEQEESEARENLYSKAIPEDIE